MENPSAAITAKVPTSEGDSDDRNDRRPPALQKHQHDDDDQRHRLVDRLDQFAGRIAR